MVHVRCVEDVGVLFAEEGRGAPLRGISRGTERSAYMGVCVCACVCLGQRLAGEEGLGLSTGGVGAQRAAQRQLAGARLLGLEVGVDQVCQSLRGERTHTHTHSVAEGHSRSQGGKLINTWSAF